MIVLVLLLLGLVLGSFVNALVWRLHEGRDWVRERSECPHCHHQLAPRDLVPVVSWLLLRGRCRYCHEPIPDSPFVELAVPVLFLVSYYCWPVPLEGAGSLDFALWLLFVVGFVALAVYDLRWLLLPDVIIFPLMGLAAFQVLADHFLFDGTWQALASAAAAAALISGFFLALYHFSKGRWIGFGDVKLAVILGLLAGNLAEAVLLLFIASLVGTLIALPLVLSGKAHRKTLLPFGPLLITAVIVVQLWGASIVSWYTGLFV